MPVYSAISLFVTFVSVMILTFLGTKSGTMTSFNISLISLTRSGKSDGFDSDSTTHVRRVDRGGARTKSGHVSLKECSTRDEFQVLRVLNIKDQWLRLKFDTTPKWIPCLITIIRWEIIQQLTH